MTSQTDWEGLPALLSGFTAGKASSAQVNKTLRQAIVMAFVLAQYISDSTAVDVLDNGDVGAILSNLNTALLTTVRARLLNIQTFSSSGTYTKTAGARFICMKV